MHCVDQYLQGNGHAYVFEFLLVGSGADINARSPNGRTALHIASSQGHGHIVDLLLEKGADIDAEDNHGETALSIAEHFGFKSCGRHLFLFHWQQRAKKVTPARNIPLMAHQKNDSLRPVWKHGQMVKHLFFGKLL